MKPLVFLVAMLLVGCVSNKPQYVLVPCKFPPIAKPAFSFSTTPVDVPMLDKIKALLTEREERLMYEEKLELILKTCS